MKTVTDDFDDYFYWLSAIVRSDLDQYSELLWTLYDIDFITVLELDESRAVEGLLLREEFYDADRTADWIMFMNRDCSVLEALIPMARRIDGMTTDENCGDRTSVWFWEMLDNLGIAKYTNSLLCDGDSWIDIHMILSAWMNREFDENGVGSPFPLRLPKHDQRRRTMMYQMYDYVTEKDFADGSTPIFGF